MKQLLVSVLFVSSVLIAAEDWFPYPSSFRLRDLPTDNAIFQAERDIVLEAGSSSVLLVGKSESSDGNACWMKYSSFPKHRRILADTNFTVTQVQVLGDSNDGDSNRERVVVQFVPAGGTEFSVECSRWEKEWNEDWAEYDESSSGDHGVTFLAGAFRILRLETIVDGE